MLALIRIIALVACAAIAVSLKIDNGKVLIIQNKGGGHGTIGYYLCKELLANNPSLDIAMIQEKCSYSKAPFSSYDELKSMGVKILDMNLGDEKPEFLDPEYAKQFADFKADYIIDNWSKSTLNASFVVDIAKKHSPEQLLFVSSAGMYETSPVLPLIESDAVKVNGARKIEQHYSESGFPFTFLRPQYIYGEKSNKRYLDYFIGRAVRSLHIPLPLSSEQLVALTHVEDVASLIASAVGHDGAMNEVFNCGTDRFVSYKGICAMVHEELGTPAEEIQYMYFDPLLYSTVMFPFRRETFITSPSKAKKLLGWKPKHNLAEDIKREVSDYKESAACEKKWVLDDLRADVEILASKDEEFMFTYPFFDRSDINREFAEMPYDFTRVDSDRPVRPRPQ